MENQAILHGRATFLTAIQIICLFGYLYVRGKETTSLEGIEQYFKISLLIILFKKWILAKVWGKKKIG